MKNVNPQECFVFDPTDVELIEFFLKRKLRNEPLPHDLVSENEFVYKTEPWRLFDKLAKECFYVFASLEKKGDQRKRRMVGCGTWKGQHREDVFRDGVKIGQKKMLSFEENRKASGSDRSSKNENGRWIMHEYSLDDSAECVLCKIRNKDKNKSKNQSDQSLNPPGVNHQTGHRQTNPSHEPIDNLLFTNWFQRPKLLTNESQKTVVKRRLPAKEGNGSIGSYDEQSHGTSEQNHFGSKVQRTEIQSRLMNPSQPTDARTLLLLQEVNQAGFGYNGLPPLPDQPMSLIDSNSFPMNQVINQSQRTNDHNFTGQRPRKNDQIRFTSQNQEPNLHTRVPGLFPRTNIPNMYQTNIGSYNPSPGLPNGLVNTNPCYIVPNQFMNSPLAQITNSRIRFTNQLQRTDVQRQVTDPYRETGEPTVLLAQELTENALSCSELRPEPEEWMSYSNFDE